MSEQSMNRTFAKVVALVVLGCAALGVLLHTLNSANHRPEGLAERWLHAVSDTGRSGIRADATRRTEKLGPIALLSPDRARDRASPSAPCANRVPPLLRMSLPMPNDDASTTPRMRPAIIQATAIHLW